MPSIFPSGQSASPSYSRERPVLSWVILTGEYPPQPGGVGDYTRLVARALAAAGDEVQVWAPPITGRDEGDAGVTVHRLPDHFGLRSLLVLSRMLKDLSPTARILVQYVPQAFGWKGMNLLFFFWLWMQRKRCRIEVMFHEVATTWSLGWRWRDLRRNVLAATTRIMAFFVARSARRIFVSIPAWTKMLKPLTAQALKIEWLPLPTNTHTLVDRKRVAERRQVLRGRSDYLLGTFRADFGTCLDIQNVQFDTFSLQPVNALLITLPGILSHNPDTAVVLLGHGGSRLRDQLLSNWPAFRGRISATGYLGGQDAAEHLAACDLLIQPYVDGVSSRRTSAMAGLALGLPTLTMTGPLTEPIWAQSRAVELAPSLDALAAAVGPLLANEKERLRLALAAKVFYQEYFQIDRAIGRLRNEIGST
jgi:glycosyltransferase involved in cell wall biosynthesis